MKVQEDIKTTLTSRLFLFGNLLISLGILLVTSGGGWDISNHLLNKPETFFSPPHALMYAGVAIALIGTVLMFLKWHRFESGQKSHYKFPVMLGIVGILVLTSAGPIDFVWHSSFGLDGLLSPPHLILITGMFLCSISSMISISRSGYHQRMQKYSLHNFLTILAILPVWMVASGYIYSFSLPFSQTEYFDFNPDISFAAVFATIASPFVISTVMILSSRLAGYRFGILSLLGIILLVINALNSIMPNPSLEPTLPFYFMTIIPFVIADAIVSSSQKKSAVMASGAILGSTFYFLYFPLITHVYNEVLYDRIVSASVTANIYFEMMPEIFPIIIGPAIACGVLGARFSDNLLKKILSQN